MVLVSKINLQGERKLEMKKKILLILGSLLLIFVLVMAIIVIKDRNKVAILGYHSVMPRAINTTGDNLIVDSEKFEKELKTLKLLGYKTMTIDEYYCWKNKQCKKEGKQVLITFDDGYNNNYEYAYPLLKKYQMNATVFCVGSYVMGDGILHMNKETLDKVRKEYPNIDIASHSYAMHFHSEKTYDEVTEDINKMKSLIDTEYYAYPFGDWNEEYIRALKDNGYKMAFTFGPSREHRKSDLKDDNYKVPRLNISNDMPMYKFILRLILPM